MPLLKFPPSLQTSCLDVLSQLTQDQWDRPHIAVWLPRITSWRQPHNINANLYQALLDHLVKTEQLQTWHLHYVAHESLKSLKLDKCVNILDMVSVQTISMRCQNLQDISLYLCKQLSPEGIQLILWNAHYLRVLDLTYTKADDTSMAALACACPELHKLDMSGTNVTDIGLFELCGLGEAGEGCKKLSRLMIHGIQVTLFGLSYVIKALKQLRELGTDLNSGLVLYGIYHDFLLQDLPLGTLKLDYVTFSSRIVDSFPVPASYIKAVKLCPNLTGLVLRADMVPSIDEEVLQGLSLLNHLHVDEEEYRQGTFQRDIVPFLSKVGAKMESVTLSGFSDVDMLAISVHCPNVQTLSLENVQGFAQQPAQQVKDCAFENLASIVIEIPDEVPQEPLQFQLKRVLRNAPVMEVLHLWGVQCFTDDFMMDVMKKNKFILLTRLRLIECHGVTQKTIKALMNSAKYFSNVVVDECNKLKKKDLQDLRELAANRNLFFSVEEGWGKMYDNSNNEEAQWAAM